MARPFRVGMTAHDRSETRRGADGNSYLTSMRTSRTDRHRRQVSPPRRVQATADALVSLALALLRCHSIDELRAMHAAAAPSTPEANLLRDVLHIAQNVCKEGH